MLVTYRLPIFRPSGLRLLFFRNPKQYSMLVLEYEYGLEIQTRKPTAFMCLIDSRQVWYLAPSISSMEFSRKDRSSELSLAASFEMKRQNDLWSVFTCASEQYTLPSVQIAI